MIKLECIDCHKIVYAPEKNNQRLKQNLKRGFICLCYDCDNKRWWKEEHAGLHKDLTLNQIAKEELSRKIINFV